MHHIELKVICNSPQLKETQKFVEHMHQREDGFRRKIKVSQLLLRAPLLLKRVLLSCKRWSMQDLQLKIDIKGREVKRLEIKLAKVSKGVPSRYLRNRP